MSEKTSEKRKIVDIGSEHTDEDILALDQKGYGLRFSEKDFRDLSDETLRAMTRENARDYWITKGVVKALAKNVARKEAGFDGIEIPNDPFRSKPRKKLEMRGIPKGWIGIWKRPDEVEEWKAMGAKLVGSEVETPNATQTATSRVIAAKDGKDDLVAMMIPLKLHEQHLQANALLSRQRAGATVKEVARLVAKSNKHLESVVDLPGVTEETRTEEVTIKEDIRRRA